MGMHFSQVTTIYSIDLIFNYFLIIVTVHPLFFEKIKPSLPTVAPYD